MKWFALLLALSTYLLSSRNLQAQTGDVTVHFSDSLYLADESNKNAKLTIVLNGTPTDIVKVTYKTSSGTAVVGVDYGKDSTEITDTVTFHPGKATSKVIKIPLIDNGDYSNQIVSFTVKLTEASGATIVAPATATVNILDNDPAPTCKIKIAGVAVDKQNNPGGYLPVNANNDNKSPLTYADGVTLVPANAFGIPKKRDRDVQPMTAFDLDLLPLTLKTTGLKVGGAEKVVLSVSAAEGARGSIWFYDDLLKSKVVGIPSNWNAGEVPFQVVVEGKLESALHMEQTLKLQIKQGDVVVATDTCVLTVTPVLSDLQVFGNLADTGPFLEKFPGTEDWFVNSAAGAGLSGERTRASARWNKVGGSLRFIQTASLSNNLPGGQGADLGPRKYDFAGANAGKSLVDSINEKQIPFYKQGEVTANDDGIATNSVNDSPKLFLSAGPDNLFVNSVLPAVGGTTKVDVTFNFVTHAAIAYHDKSIYCLGQQSWNVRFQGSVTQPEAKMFKFDPGTNNALNGSGLFGPGVRNNANPAATGPVFANDGDQGWR